MIHAAGCHRDETAPAVVLQTLGSAEAFADQGQAEWPPETLYFDWTQTVWAYGIHRLYVASGDESRHDYYTDWMLHNLDGFSGDEHEQFNASDAISPALLASLAMIEDPTLDLTPITDAADTYLATIERTSQGGIPHWAPEHPLNPPHQIWLDSQFMFGVFLLSQYDRTGDSSYLDEFISQYEIFSATCRDPDDQLYRHAWDDVAGVNIPTDAVYWARGNSWVLVAAAEMLRRVSGDSEAWARVAPLFLAHASAVADLQETADGLWHTVLNSPQGDDPDNYTETSASALIIYAFTVGIDSGALDSAVYLPKIAAALDGLNARITEQTDGSLKLSGTSFGTNVGDYDYYLSIPTGDDLMLGLGAVVVAFDEIDGLEIPAPEQD